MIKARISLFVLLGIYLGVVSLNAKEVQYYVSLEHINVTYVNPEYGYMNATAARPGRWDYKYYITYYLNTLKTLDNDLKMDIYLYEFRSNEYRRGFVEMHFGFCDLIDKDPLFGSVLRGAMEKCPLPPGEYHISNLSIPDLPLLRTFPFNKGRIFVVGTQSSTGVNVGRGYVDMEIKVKPNRKHKNGTKASLVF